MLNLNKLVNKECCWTNFNISLNVEWREGGGLQDKLIYLTKTHLNITKKSRIIFKPKIEKINFLANDYSAIKWQTWEHPGLEDMVKHNDHNMTSYDDGDS